LITPSPNADPTVSVVICTHSELRWDLLGAAITAVDAQTRRCDELLVVVDHNDGLLRRAQAAYPHVTVLANQDRAGLAGARNTGVARSKGDVVVFLDDDAVAEPRCLEQLIDVYADPRVLGAGGAALPVWPNGRPRWFPGEFDWVVGCTYTGLPRETAPVRNPIGACMSFRRVAFERAGAFTNGIGRTASDVMGCEETEFSIRAQRAVPHSRLVYVPGARVHHHVHPGRDRWRYFFSRCFAEGRSKALVAAATGARDALASEWPYTVKVLSAGALRGVGSSVRGHPAGLLRATAIGAGLTATTCGYVTGRMRARRSRPRRAVRRPA
jgi:GT2 family glycosyltransferase